MRTPQRRGLRVTPILDFLRNRQENEPKEDARVPRTLCVAKPDNEAAPYAAMRRCPIRSGAHNLAIAARLALLGALHDSIMLASVTGFNRSGLAETRFAQTNPRG